MIAKYKMTSFRSAVSAATYRGYRRATSAMTHRRSARDTSVSQSASVCITFDNTYNGIRDNFHSERRLFDLSQRVHAGSLMPRDRRLHDATSSYRRANVNG